MHTALQLIIASAVTGGITAGIVSIVKRHQWFRLVRYVYDRETSQGRAVDPLSLLALAREPDPALSLRPARQQPGHRETASTDEPNADPAHKNAEEGPLPS